MNMEKRDIKNLGVQRAYASFDISEIKEAGAGKKRTFTGIASTIEADLMDDVVVPDGADFSLPLPLLFGQDSNQPIGWVRAARIKKDRIEVYCEVADINEADSPDLKAELDRRWAQLKSGLVRGLSIGFRAIETAQIDGSWGVKFLKWRWLELSACVIPANQASGVVSMKQIKAADHSLLAAQGKEKRGVVFLDPPPGASGTKDQPARAGFYTPVLRKEMK